MIKFYTPPDKYGNHQLLKVYDNGKVICDWQYCNRQLYNKNRETESEWCWHIELFLDAVHNGDISKYEEL